MDPRSRARDRGGSSGYDDPRRRDDAYGGSAYAPPPGGPARGAAPGGPGPDRYHPYGGGGHSGAPGQPGRPLAGPPGVGMGPLPPPPGPGGAYADPRAAAYAGGGYAAAPHHHHHHHGPPPGPGMAPAPYGAYPPPPGPGPGPAPAAPTPHPGYAARPPPAAAAHLPPPPAAYPSAPLPAAAPGGAAPLAAGHVEEVIVCPSECAGKVIGHGGESINAIQSRSGAHVKIQSSRDVAPGQPRRVTITGAPHAVADAAQTVNDIIREHGGGARGAGGGGGGGGGASQGGTGQVEMPVDLAHDQIGRVIGRGGETIRRLSEESGARLQIERDRERVMIRGTQDQCVRAKELVLDILNDPNPPGAPAHSGGGASQGGSAYAKHVMPANGCEGKIIGKGGESIRELCQRSGARIQIDKDQGTVSIQGRREQVDAAIELVQAIVDEGPTVYMRPGGQPGEGGGAYGRGGGGGYARGGGYGDGGGGGGGGYADAAGGGGGDDAAAAGGAKPLWETHESPEGYTYYYNTVTGETQWDQPDDFPGEAPAE